MPQQDTQDYAGPSWEGLFASTPVTADTVNVGTDGSQVISTNLDQSAVDLASLTFQSPSRLRVGSAAGPLKYEMSGPLRWEQGAGHLFFEISTSTDTSSLVAGPNFNLVGGGTSALIEVTNRGELFVSEDVTLTAVNFYGGGFGEIEVKAADTFALAMYGGQLVTRRNMTTAALYDAELITEDGDVTLTTLTAGPGGRTRWSGGDITTYNAFTGSFFDAMKSRKPFTIGTLNLADGAEIKLPTWVTVSTTNYLGQRVTTG